MRRPCPHAFRFRIPIRKMTTVQPPVLRGVCRTAGNVPAGSPSSGASVFIVHTPYQAGFAVDLLAHLQVRRALVFCEGEALMLRFRSLLDAADCLGGGSCELHSIPLVRPQSVGRSGFRLMQKSIETVLSALGKTAPQETAFYLSDLCWPINNYIYAKYRGNSKFYLIEDGIGSYLASHWKWRDYVRALGRFGLAKARLGPQFALYFGDRMGGGDGGVEAQYVRAPEFCDATCEVRGVPRSVKPAAGLSIPDSSVVFLDQPLARYWGIEQHKAALAAFAGAYCGDGSRVYVKPHHFALDGAAYKELFPAAELISEGAPIEDYAVGRDVVFSSFMSSALFNLKLLYGKKVRCVAFMPDRALRAVGSRRRDIERIRRKFAQVGVEICDSIIC